MKDLDGKANQAEPRQLFERAVHGLDAAAANRLRLARRAALRESGAAGPARRHWAPAFATAALLVLGLAWWLPQRTSAPAPTPTAAVAAAPDVAELVVEGEDDELYAWLGEAPVAAEADPEQRL